MSQDRLPPIPTPPDQRWRQFRQTGLPTLAFISVLILSVWLWGVNLANPLVMGQAEAQQADIVSPVGGQLVSLQASLFQKVTAGDILAVVAVADPEVFSNTLAVIRAEMGAIAAEAEFSPANRMRFAELQVQWLELRADLATLKPNLEFARSELERIKQLNAQGIADQAGLELARRNATRLEEEVLEKEKAAAVAEKALSGLSPEGTAQESGVVQRQLEVAAEKFRLAEAKLQPIVLRAPISGHVTKLAAANQAYVTRGQVVASIANPKAERIVGYIPQPVRVEPRIGMPVEVRSRGAGRIVARSVVADIGPRIELFDAPLRIRGMGAAQERGLPIVVSVPDQMPLRPGELVELRLITN